MSRPTGKRFEHRQPGLEDEEAGTSAVGSPARETPGLRLSRMSAAAVVAALLLSIGALSLGAYVVSGRSIGPAAQQVGSAALQVVRAVDQSTPASVDEVGEDIFSQIFGSERSPTVVEQGTGRLVHAAKAVFRLLLASLLAAMLAFRPHKYTPALRRNPHVAETQILLAVVASALMMIVADNAARAFGIFAAASLVR
ncbi:MAG TPA: hypothetical protein VFB82_06535, partial [Blastocatellia bacterium]|nr:hypothetical protein [Blastocatellia bacterium]